MWQWTCRSRLRSTHDYRPTGSSHESTRCRQTCVASAPAPNIAQSQQASYRLQWPLLLLTTAALLANRTKATTHTHTCLTALFPRLPKWAGTRKVKLLWILLKQETVSGSGISWAICKSAPRSRQITAPAPHHSVFYRPDALPAAQPTASKHWRHNQSHQYSNNRKMASKK